MRKNDAVLTGEELPSKELALLLCVHVNSHPTGTYKRDLFSEIDDYNRMEHDVVAYQQIGVETLHKVDLTLEHDIDQVSNIVLARKV